MKIKKDINKFIFRGYDIRGVVDKDIDIDTAYTIGVGFGSKLNELSLNKCVVGHDNRISSPDLHQAIIQGLIDTGVNVIDIGLCTTPMYYYACLHLKIESGIMITASHNPKDENGFKFAFSNYENAKGKEIEDFYNFIVKGCFHYGEGSITKKDVKEDYLSALTDNLSFGKRKVKVVLDSGNGTTSILLDDVFKRVNANYTLINGISDGTFPNHHPDPSIESNLSELKQVVKDKKFDVGLAFDGDGDRVGVISNKGNFIPIDYYMIIIIRDIINKVSNKTFLYDVKCSKSLEDEIIKLGGTPYCYRTGNSYTRAKVKELDLAFGGELSGHVYFRDKFLGFDSGIYAGLRLLEILSNTDKTLEELLDGINRYYSTPEMKYKTTDEIKFEVIRKIEDYCKDKNYTYNNIDGVRVTFDDSWASVRASNTGPNLTARFEASSEERLESIKNEFESLIFKYNK